MRKAPASAMVLALSRPEGRALRWEEAVVLSSLKLRGLEFAAGARGRQGDCGEGGEEDGEGLHFGVLVGVWCWELSAVVE